MLTPSSQKPIKFLPRLMKVFAVACSTKMKRNHQPQEQQEEWIWGNTRGGGGAPLKTANGEQVTNLRGVIKGTTKIDTGYQSPTRSNYDDDRRRDYSDRRRDDDVRDRRRDYDDDDTKRYHSPIKGKDADGYGSRASNVANSPQKRGFRDINVDDSERENRAR
jgi:hypothetical protein